MPLDRRYKWKLQEYRHQERSAWIDGFSWEDHRGTINEFSKLIRLDENGDQTLSEWEQILRILDHIHHLVFDNQNLQAPVSAARDAFTLYEAARLGHAAFTCVEISVLLQHVFTACGFPSRVINLRQPGSEEGIGKGHVVTDVWCNDLRKWVVLDPSFNTFYTDATGRILSAFEVHDMYSAGMSDKIVMANERHMKENLRHWGSKEDTSFENVHVPEGFEREEVWNSLPSKTDFVTFRSFYLSYFRHLIWYTDYSLLRAPNNSVFYYDEGDTPPIVFQRLRVQHTYTQNRDRLDFEINGVEIQWIPEHLNDGHTRPLEENQVLRVMLSHSVPWFDHYCICLGDEAYAQIGNELILNIGDRTDLRVTPVNHKGVAGIESKVVISMKSA